MAEVVEDPLALERQVCFALAATSRSVIGLYRPILEPLGLTHPQYLVMLALWERSPRTMRDIADALYLEPPTLSPLLKRLEALGCITRPRNPQNERELRVELTERGRALRDEAVHVPEQVVDRLGVPLHVLEEVRDRLTDLLAATRSAGAPSNGAAAVPERDVAAETEHRVAPVPESAGTPPGGMLLPAR